ncbi:hypothetical protein FEM03_08060 [Phragmitibacter flavus]|uniref:DUF3078 domain-containing protein n=1 Tax=Phragmitibacter flavus TaxID=2576071 RepID=A0A5R8KGP7_9BACT|nr:hypothetical protein [Phragmitibacter flavus]TLD71470.1 hypothetical protein FEM03_08060 [Phragmitibacter flavus]
MRFYVLTIFVVCFATLAFGKVAPAGYVSKSDIESYLKVKDAATGNKGVFTISKWIDFYGDSEIYDASLINEFEKEATKLVMPAKPKQGFQGFKIRESSSDIMATEDPTLEAVARKKKDDLKGASVSFSYNFKNDSDTWIGKAAIIAPFKWDRNTEYENGSPMTLMSYGLVPSLTLNQLESTDPKHSEIDQLIYRVGGFATLYGPRPYLTELNVRGFGTYGTNFAHDLSIHAFEFEVEPRWHLGQRFAIGYRTSLIDRDTNTAGEAPDYSKNSWLAYQSRLYLKGSVGSVTDSASLPEVNEGSFFRLGPVLELKLDPFFHEKLSINFSYRYFFTIEGSDQNNSLLETGVEWMLFGSKEEGKSVSLKASYIQGGIDLTQQDTETLLLGFGITY